MTAVQQHLPLADPPSKPANDWRLDAGTRQVGLRGLAEARAALKAATERFDAREAIAARGSHRHAA